jgi:hypothetical protein
LNTICEPGCGEVPYQVSDAVLGMPCAGTAMYSAAST